MAGRFGTAARNATANTNTAGGLTIARLSIGGVNLPALTVSKGGKPIAYAYVGPDSVFLHTVTNGVVSDTGREVEMEEVFGLILKNA